MKNSTKETITAEVGHLINISLESMMGSTGYGWEVAELNGDINLFDITVQNSSRSIGPVEQIFSVRGTAKGEGYLKFVLVAPWKIEEPAQIIEYTITVNEASDYDKDLDDLKLKGFVSKPRVSVGNLTTKMLYAVQPPNNVFPDPNSVGDPRIKYGIPPRLFKYGFPPQPKYGFPVINALYNIRPEFRRGNPRLYYGFPSQSADRNWTIMPYGFPNPTDPNCQCDPCDDDCC